MRPIQKIKVVKKAKTDFNGSYQLFIDNQPLENWINDVALRATKKPWPDRAKLFIDPVELKRSVNESGELYIGVCANCMASGVRESGDIGLGPFEVSHSDKGVEWIVRLTKDYQEAEGKLVFDTAQYLKELAKID